MGTLRLGVKVADGKVQWLDELPAVTATFRPGYTEYQLADAKAGWKATLGIAPAMDFHGFALPRRVRHGSAAGLAVRRHLLALRREQRQPRRDPRPAARITEPNLPNGIVLAGWDAAGEGGESAGPGAAGGVRRRPSPGGSITWSPRGVSPVQPRRADKTMARLDTPAAAAWPEGRDEAEAIVVRLLHRPALKPGEHFARSWPRPASNCTARRHWWDRRREELQIRTPDPHFNALINWERCRRVSSPGPGPGAGGRSGRLCAHLGGLVRQGVGRRPPGHGGVPAVLRGHAGRRRLHRWRSPSLVAFHRRNNRPYWVDHVWRHYTWTGDRRLFATCGRPCARPSPGSSGTTIPTATACSATGTSTGTATPAARAQSRPRRAP